MRVIPVELDAETVAALEVERELLGFENRSAYIRWLLEHRGTIDHREEADRPVLLEAYRERIAQLEERLANAEAASRQTAETRRVSTEEVDSESIDGDGTGESDGESRPGIEYEAGDGGWTPSRSDPTVQIRGTPRTTVVSDSDSKSDADADANAESAGNESDVWNGEKAKSGDERQNDERDRSRTRRARDDPGDSIDREPTPEPEPEPESEQERPPKTDTSTNANANTNTNTDTDTKPESERELALESTDADRNEVISAMNLTPERVERIREDPVAEDAGVLGNVEVDRLDELSRRAVAKTRKRLDRDVETGLEYTSSTSLAAADVRPGEDVVDLETLSVRGRSAEIVERRREVAGHAIAFLRDRGRARRSDFVDALYEEYPAGYETTDSWWRCLKEALKQVDAIDGGEGSRVWRFRR